ncbi:MAG: hypothetical protein ACREE2_20860, partial [Stellaceae bacterium]
VPGRKPEPPPVGANAPSGPGEAVATGEPGATIPASPPEVPPPSTRELVGLDQPAVRQLFGAATEQTSQPPATVWRYRSATCELELFFYLDLRSGKMRTLHYRFKGNPLDPAGQQDCLKSLVVARGN